MNHFDSDQSEEIEAGVIAGLDVSWYAKPEFMAIQMRQIRLGLQEKLDVSVYAKKEYDWFQMEEIRKGMSGGVDYGAYANPKLNFEKMRQIRKGLEDGINLSAFSGLSAGVLKQLRLAILSQVSIVDYIKEGYDEEQLEEIRLGLEKGLDIKSHISPEFRGAAIREICLGLEEGIDPSVYATGNYRWRQMKQVRLGLFHRIDVSQYTNPLYEWEQMREIRLGLEEGIDVSSYRNFMYTWADMKRIRMRHLDAELEDIIEITDDIESEDVQRIDHDKFAVFLSNDEMEACIEVRCKKGETVKRSEIMKVLRAEGIVRGIKDEEIDRLVEEKKYHETIVVARGELPQRGQDGWYEFFFDTTLDKKPPILEDGSADYRHVKWYEYVEAGKKLAYYHEPEVGKNGYTVTGNILPAKKGREKLVLSGKGFELLTDGRTYISSLNGIVNLVEETKMEVSHTYIVEEVSPATGDISFEGCVLVRGAVRSGAVIQATEDIIVNGVVETAVLKSGGEILLRQGANGSVGGLIQAEKMVTGKFFEAMQVISGGDICANYCMNCDMMAQGKVRIQGTKGVIVGGITRALRGVKAVNVGNQVHISTVVQVGINELVLNERKTLEKEIHEAKRQLKILQNAYEDFKRKYPAEVRNTMNMFLKIENAIYTKNLQLTAMGTKKEEIDEKINGLRGARVKVTGVLHEGTTVIVDNVRWRGDSLMDVNVRCTAQGKIMVCSN